MQLLDQGRASFDRRAWADAFDAFARAEAEADAPLGAEDLERLALAAGLTGREDAFLGALERMHKRCVDAQQKVPAARAAFWIGFFLTLFGQPSAAGWLARARRLVESEDLRCAIRGYVLLPDAYRHLAALEDEAARATANEAAAIGERCGDGDLVALARAVEGRALFRLGRADAGLELLDETMLSVTSDELSPLVTGIVYCNALTCCQEAYVLDRAHEWTSALARWCSDQPQLITFTGHCLVHRVEILELAGAWDDAGEELRQIRERTVTGDPEVMGDACYREGELFRLRGELEAAEEAYRRATESGRDAQPGLALLRLAQGQAGAAVNAIRRVLATTTPRWQRAHFLPAAVEILLAAGEIDEARAASAELDEIASDHRTEILIAMAAQARGALALGAGDARAAIEPLRHAFLVWNRAGAPYVAARIRVLLARALESLGDRDGAELENAAARKVFVELGIVEAEPPAKAQRAQSHGLSKRELEVLRLLASGKTNKIIGRDLYVSERTVDRHVSNIFAKIGVSTRAAATAFAYENALVATSDG